MTLHCQVYSETIDKAFPLKLGDDTVVDKILIKNLESRPQRLLRVTGTTQVQLSVKEDSDFSQSLSPNTVLSFEDEFILFVKVSVLDDIKTLVSSGLIMEYIDEY